MSEFKLYQQLDQTDVISGKTNTVSSGFFPEERISFLQSLFKTDSTQKELFGSNGEYDVLNGLYYTNVYNNTDSDKQLLFSISYGDNDGGGVKSGSVFQNTKSIYSQYKNLLLGIADLDGLFSFKTGSVSSNTYITSSEIFVINFSKNLMKNQIDKGQWSFSISGSNGSSSLYLIDENPLLTSAEKKEERLVYQVVSGSYDINLGQNVAEGGYHGLGLFYPKNGIIILNAEKLSELSGFSYDSGSSSPTDVDNSLTFFNHLVGVNNSYMRVRKSESIPSTHYFIRVKNQDFNFSNNPSFAYQQNSGSYTRGEILESLSSDPKTFVTTVGLYNEFNELIAVAKLSQPTKKDFTNELLIRVRLDF